MAMNFVMNVTLADIKLNKINMHYYDIYIKSHADSPDYEDSVIAQNRIEASEKFAKKINRNSEDTWSPEDLIKYIEER